MRLEREQSRISDEPLFLHMLAATQDAVRFHPSPGEGFVVDKLVRVGGSDFRDTLVALVESREQNGSGSELVSFVYDIVSSEYR